MAKRPLAGSAATPIGWVARLGRWFRARRRDWIRLLDARISIVPIAFGILLLAQSQGLDVVRGLADGANVYLRSGEPWSGAALASYFRWFCFLAACAWSGLIAWYWPHLIARARTNRDEPGWFTWVRIGLGLAPLSAAVAAIAVTGRDDLGEIWLALLFFAIAALAMLVFFVRRRKPAGTRATGWRSRPSLLLNWLLARLGGRRPSLTRGDEAFILITFWVSFLILLLFTIAGIRTHFAWAVGSAAIAFGAVGSMIASVSGVAWLVSGVRLPVITIGAGALLVFSCSNDNHRIRALGGDDIAARPTMLEAYERWARANPDGPVVLVATAGGASRAAYWTGAVLRALDDRTAGRFGRQLFAISSVSGGSLAAVGFAGWRADHRFGEGMCRYSAAERLEFDRALFGSDYLSPALGGLLYPDLVQRFLPFPLLPDRAASLEEAWIFGWRNAAEGADESCLAPAGASDRMAEDFLRIWGRSLAADSPAAPWIPITLLNGTAVETGKRIITAPVQIDRGIFEDSYDFFALFPRRISAATAVMNSARFPLISPAATVPLPDGRVMRMVDGGYFENGGVETIYDLARYIRTIDSNRPILIIEITNDDVVAADENTRSDLARYPNGLNATQTIQARLPVSAPSSRASAMATGPGSILQAFYRTRTSRSVLAAKRLSAVQAAGLGPNTYRASFNLGPLLPRRRTAMSWSLSLSSRLAIDGALGGDFSFESEAGRRQLRLKRVEPTRDLSCQRVVANQIASAIDGVNRPLGTACPATWPEAGWTGVPIRPEALRGPAPRRAPPAAAALRP